MAQATVIARRWAWILACLPLWTLGGTPLAAVPAPTLERARDLAGDAKLLRQRRVPLLVLYSQTDCTWCERTRREFLLPMTKDPASAARILVRQIDIDSDAPLTDFQGRTTTHRVFAAAQRAKFTPTLMFYGPDGRAVAAPIVGFLLADYYGTYIERGIDDGLAALHAVRP